MSELVEEVRAGSLAVLETLKQIRTGTERGDNSDQTSIIRAIHDSKASLLAEIVQLKSSDFLDLVRPSGADMQTLHQSIVAELGKRPEEKLLPEMLNGIRRVETMNADVLSEMRAGLAGIRNDVGLSDVLSVVQSTCASAADLSVAAISETRAELQKIRECDVVELLDAIRTTGISAADKSSPPSSESRADFVPLRNTHTQVGDTSLAVSDTREDYLDMERTLFFERQNVDP
jgi:hypothetical protein